MPSVFIERQASMMLWRFFSRGFGQHGSFHQREGGRRKDVASQYAAAERRQAGIRSRRARKRLTRGVRSSGSIDRPQDRLLAEAPYEISSGILRHSRRDGLERPEIRGGVRGNRISRRRAGARRDSRRLSSPVARPSPARPRGRRAERQPRRSSSANGASPPTIGTATGRARSRKRWPSATSPTSSTRARTAA